MNLSPLRLAAGAVALATVLVAAPAVADGPPPTWIWVDAQPWTCVREIGPFARNLELACDALGSQCQVASSVKEASFRATLTCDDTSSWTLDLQKIDGAPVLKLTLEGDHEQRLRKAALWVANASVGEPPPRSKRAAAAPAAEPDAEPAVPAEAAVVAPPAVPPPPAVPALPADVPDAVQPRAQEPRGGLQLSGLVALSNAHGADAMAGGRIAAAFHLAGPLALGPTFTYARSVAHDGGDTLLLGGATLGVGAPFGGRWVGASIEGGAGASIGGASGYTLEHGNAMAVPDGHSTFSYVDSEVKPVGYARLALTLQAPIDFAVRPTVSFAAMHVTDIGGAAAELAMLDIGVAWPGW